MAAGHKSGIQYARVVQITKTSIFVLRPNAFLSIFLGGDVLPNIAFESPLSAVRSPSPSDNPVQRRTVHVNYEYLLGR